MKTAPEMTYTVSGGALSSTQSNVTCHGSHAIVSISDLMCTCFSLGVGINVCLYVCLTVIVSIRGVPEIPGVAGLSAECRQKVYRSEVCLKC